VEELCKNPSCHNIEAAVRHHDIDRNQSKSAKEPVDDDVKQFMLGNGGRGDPLPGQTD